MNPLSDDYRPLKLAALGLFIAGTAAYWTYLASAYPESWGAAHRAPADYDGKNLTFSLYLVDSVIDANHYTLRKGTWVALIEGPSAEIHVGDDISVGGTFRASDEATVEQWREVHEMRAGKRWLGISAVVIFVALLPVWFGVRKNRIVERA